MKFSTKAVLLLSNLFLVATSVSTKQHKNNRVLAKQTREARRRVTPTLDPIFSRLQLLSLLINKNDRVLASTKEQKNMVIPKQSDIQRKMEEIKQKININVSEEIKADSTEVLTADKKDHTVHSKVFMVPSLRMIVISHFYELYNVLA